MCYQCEYKLKLQFQHFNFYLLDFIQTTNCALSIWLRSHGGQARHSKSVLALSDDRTWARKAILHQENHKDTQILLTKQGQKTGIRPKVVFYQSSYSSESDQTGLCIHLQRWEPARIVSVYTVGCKDVSVSFYFSSG